MIEPIPPEMQEEEVVDTARRLLGTPYIWGGDDPSGFDCSGFVLECLKSVGVVGEKDDFTADALWQMFKHKEVPKPRRGALMFYLTQEGKAYHVVLCINQCLQIGSSGGGVSDTTNAQAWRDNAYAKKRPIVKSDRTRWVYLFGPQPQ